MFRIVEANDPCWQSAYAGFRPEHRDVFHDPGFAMAYSEVIDPGDRILAAIFSSGSTQILYPFVVRNLGSVLGHQGIADDYFDIVSMYGRGGALCSCADTEAIDAFSAEFSEWCREQKVVCSFDRYHPVMENQAFAATGAKIINVGEFVVVDLQPSVENIETNFKHSMRKAIRRGDRAGVVVEIDDDLQNLERFIEIYHQTLDRNQARPFYYFPVKFYDAIDRHMPGRFRFYYGLSDNEIVTCELVLFSDHYGHSYIGGTLDRAFPVSANQILKRQILRDMKNRGCRHFLLGGGQISDDGVFRYKLAYAPNGARSSYVGGTVYLPEVFSDLKVRMREANLNVVEERFQFYDSA